MLDHIQYRALQSNTYDLEAQRGTLHDFTTIDDLAIEHMSKTARCDRAICILTGANLNKVAFRKVTFRMTFIASA